MKLPDKVYDVLKWVVLIVLPALTTAYVGLAVIWGWLYAEEVAKTSAVICTLLGSLLGISTAQYNKDKPPDYSGSYEDLKKDLGWDDIRDSDI